MWEQFGLVVAGGAVGSWLTHVFAVRESRLKHLLSLRAEQADRVFGPLCEAERALSRATGPGNLVPSDQLEQLEALLVCADMAMLKGRIYFTEETCARLEVLWARLMDAGYNVIDRCTTWKAVTPVQLQESYRAAKAARIAVEKDLRKAIGGGP